MNKADVIQRIKDDLAKGLIKVVSENDARYYVDTLTETIKIPLGDVDATVIAYEKYMINGETSTTNTFLTLPRVSMFIGQPDTGKTYAAINIARTFGIEPVFIMCRDNLNLETLLEDFILEDGKPVFKESLAIKALTSDKEEIIVLDEFNTLLTGVMKTFQPIFDDTSDTFAYKGVVYKKNMKCKFIVTLNDKDKGISIVPDAILSRSYLVYYDTPSLTTLANWTNFTTSYVKQIFEIYKALGILNVYGVRQLKLLKNKTTLEITNHLIGLCKMKNIDPAIVNQLQIQSLVQAL